jgi:hypothetical protein
VVKRVWHYTFSQREIWNSACKPVAEGGFAGFCDDDGNIFLSRSSFEKLLPANIRHMTESQKQMCGCKLCIDAHNMHAALMEWRKAKLKRYEELTGPLSNLDRDGDAFKSTQASMDCFVALAFPNGITKCPNGTRPPQVWESMNDAMRAMTCKPIGDTKLCPYKCCLQRCGDCTNELPVFSGETCVDGEHDQPTNFITWR